METLAIVALFYILSRFRNGASGNGTATATATANGQPSARQGVRREGVLTLTLIAYPNPANRSKKGEQAFRFSIVSDTPATFDAKGISDQMQLAIVDPGSFSGQTPQWFRDLASSVLPGAAQVKMRIVDALLPGEVQGEASIDLIRQGKVKVIKRWKPAIEKQAIQQQQIEPGFIHDRYFYWNMRNELGERVAAGRYIAIAWINTANGYLASGWLNVGVL